MAPPEKCLIMVRNLILMEIFNHFLKFTADPINGFNAQVTKSAPIIAAAPIVEPVAKVVVA